MKKFFTNLFLSSLILVGGQQVVASTHWMNHSEANKEELKETPCFETRATTGQINIGYASTADQIWPSDGLSLDYDARVGVGIILTEEMYSLYKGGKIVGMWVGWDDQTSTSQYDCFVRDGGFNGETISTGSDEVSFGWNYINLEPVTLDPMTDNLAVGFYTDLQKNVCSIPKIYPANVPNSSFLWDEKSYDGETEVWYDSKDFGKMPIILVIEDSEGKFVNMLRIDNINHDVIVTKGETLSAMYTVSNIGSNNIQNIEIKTSFGDESSVELIDFEQALPAQGGGKAILPVHCIGTGEHTISISAINGVIPTNETSFKVNLIGVPQEIADNYTNRPVVEYFVSEDNYMTVQYVEEYFYPGFESYADRITLLMPHLDDKFMTGDNDALDQLIILAGGDKTKVYVPAMTVNRANYFVTSTFNSNVQGTPMMYTIFPDFVSDLYDDIIAHPTFASVDINSTIDDTGAISVTVSGNVAEGVMPDGEDLYLSVYLMERDVYTEDQLFWDDKESGDNGGVYYHKNVIRELLTPLWGEKLTKTGGDYSMTFNTEYYEEWVKDNLYIVAFLNRSKDNDNMNLHIINSNEGNLTTSGIEGNYIPNVKIEAVNGAIVVNGATEVEVYNLSGCRVDSSNLSSGVYIVKAKVENSVMIQKVLVK